MITSSSLGDKISFRCSPLLDLALSVLILDSPERFGRQPWADAVLSRLPGDTWDKLRRHAEEVDLFALALQLEDNAHSSTTDALNLYRQLQPEGGAALADYWEAVAPHLAGRMGLLAASVQGEQARLAGMDPAAYLCSFSDRMRVVGDGEAIVLHWGQGMRVPLQDLEQIILVPSVFCPRRLMFYRVGSVQIFFYPAQRPQEDNAAHEPPESLLLGFSALADATRLKLLRLIARETLPAQEMARRLQLNESTVSRHLRLLVEAGLVARERREGKFIYYRYQGGVVAGLAAGVAQYLAGAGDWPAAGLGDGSGDDSLADLADLGGSNGEPSALFRG